MAEFWIILLAVLVLLLAWTIYLIEGQRRIERRGRLHWKRECMNAWKGESGLGSSDELA